MGIVRVSERGEREGESFRSPAEQRERIEAACKRDKLTLVAVHEEIDVSGGTALDRRHGLRAAVQAIEDGQADVLTVAYFDRLVRSLKVQDEVVSRVEAAGGKVLALDVGQVTGATAAQWLSGTTLGMMSEYYRRSIGERVAGTQAQAVARRVWPSRVPVGYLRGADGILIPDPATAPVVGRAFEVRADETTLREVRAFLREHGIERSYAAVEKMLRSRAYLGEIHFGALVNLSAHEPIVDADTWRRAQRVRVSRGRQAKSARLLARLGVLRCGSCGARMSVGGRPQYPCYRCSQPDCPGHPSIMAHIAERAVIAEVKRVYGSARGRASAKREARRIAESAERAQADLDAAIRAFAGVEDEPVAIERLAELRAARDAAREQAEHLGDHRLGLTIDLNAITDLADWRSVIRATGITAYVAPGRGADRIAFELFGE